MMFAIGLIVGLLIAVLVAVILAFFRHPIEKNVRIAGTAIGLVGPRPKGHIYEPPEETEEARERIIEENKAKGLDTKISELM